MTIKRGKPRTNRKLKSARVRAARRTRNKAAKSDPLDGFIDAAAAALDLRLEAAWKDAVKANLEVTLRLARTFADFPLPDDAEPAPVFVA
jgi:hypothetical protein